VFCLFRVLAFLVLPLTRKNARAMRWPFYTDTELSALIYQLPLDYFFHRLSIVSQIVFA